MSGIVGGRVGDHAAGAKKSNEGQDSPEPNSCAQ